MKKFLQSLTLLLAALMMPAMAVADNGYVQGDATGEGVVDMDDLTMLINYLLTNEWTETGMPENCVDLGMPSGTLWATCNIGATNPEDIGNYYAWGELEPKETYTWLNYIWNTPGSGTVTINKYNTDDNLTELLPEDDIAYVSWGSGWRMTSYDQFNELKSKCTKQWTEINGVKGHMLTGPNGNTIFIPAAGTYANSANQVGTQGNYWSRTRATSGSNAQNNAHKLYFSQSSLTVMTSGRNTGLPVRAVHAPLMDIVEGDFLRGDATGNGIVDMDDLTVLINYLLTDTWPTPDPFDYYVDLGLPSGTQWATRNVGALKPEDFGNYYSWGEIEPKETYLWNNYIWNTPGSTITINKYNADDNLTEMLPEDDAACVNYPEGRTPSKEQADELVANCTQEWTQLNGVYGILLTGPNGNTMFLPAAGYQMQGDSGVGAQGNYWTRSILPNSSWHGAGKLYFTSSTFQTGGSDRSIGYTVRAVRVQE